MGKTVKLQKWLTLMGPANYGEIQDVEDWIDTSNYGVGVLQVETPYISNCSLLVQGSDVQGGEFNTNGTFTQSATAASILYLTKGAPVGTSEKLAKLVRWKIEPSASAWEVTFQLSLVLK
jgi:hypothetical protein